MVLEYSSPIVIPESAATRPARVSAAHLRSLVVVERRDEAGTRTLQADRASLTNVDDVTRTLNTAIHTEHLTYQ